MKMSLRAKQAHFSNSVNECNMFVTFREFLCLTATTMHSTSKLLPAIAALLAATIASGPSASAQQSAPTTPFASGVQISVVAAKPARSEYGGEDKIQKVVLTVKFANTDTRTTYEGYTATISGLGQCQSETKIKKVLMQDEVTLSLPPRKTQEQVCPEVTTSFDKVGFKHGYAYYGWIIVVKDPQGKIVRVKSSAAPLEKFTELAAKLEKRMCYDSKLKPVKDPEYSSN